MNKKIAISVGQFIHRNDFDILMKAWVKCPKKNELFIIGAEATEKYLELRDRLGLNNVHFEGIKSEEELKEYYQAADFFIHLT